MAPERSPKRQKTIPDVDKSPSGQSQVSAAPALAEGSSDSILKLPQTASWYNSWSRKASPVTELARDSVSPSSLPTPESPRVQPLKPASLRSPSLAMALGKKQSSRALPVDATITKIHAEVGGSAKKGSEKTDNKAKGLSSNKQEPPKDTKSPEQRPEQQAPSKSEPKEEDNTAGDIVAQQRSSWLGWLGKADTESKASDNVLSSTSDGQSEPVEDTVQDPKPQVGVSANASEPLAASTAAANTSAKKGWLPWSSDTSEPTFRQAENSSEPEAVNAKSQPAQEKKGLPSKPVAVEGKPTAVASSATGTVESASSPPDLPHDGTKPSAWAFWSRERKVNSSASSLNTPHNGEIAISGTPSQGQPQKTSISLSKSGKEKAVQDNKIYEITTSQTESSKNMTGTEPNKKTSPPESSIKKESNTKAESNTKTEMNTKAETSAKADSSTKQDSNLVPLTIESADASATARPPENKKQKPSSKSAKEIQNVLLPQLESTLRLPEHASLIQQLARMLHLSKEPESKHLSLMKDPPRIRNALAIGVHGYFPAPLIRSVLGQPTGTSIKFADMAASSIRRLTKARGYECQVKTAALEGEGKIAERVELLWKLLLNWVEEIRKSDFVIIACHSQGVPVATMLVAKLIQFGCLTGARVGICAMAGVNMGPFIDLKTRWIGSSAAELFEFSDPTSKVSTDYLEALQIALNFGVHITFVGSIDDQLVSLESSIFTSISHPNIYRAVSIDARVNAPDFLSHLVAFALKLRNLGIQDHGLIHELSPPLAGSLYSGKGHSRVYESENCYDLAVGWTLLTTSMVGVPVVQQSSASSASNPYILPFAMRGILEEEFVRKELHGEASELLRQFDAWKPSTKVLKDVKFRLEGIRSKL